jgi:argonaute-like protein implicated in RNA metabolism and viral defense
MKEFKVEGKNFHQENDRIKLKREDLINLIDEDSLEIDATDIEDTNNLYLVLKDR